MSTLTARLAASADRPAAARDFDAFYTAHRAALLAHAHRRTRSREDAADACQEAFARAWQQWETVAGLAALMGWLVVVVNHLLVDGWRRRSYAADRLPLLTTPPAAPEPADGWSVRAALADLGPDTRRTLELFYFEDWPVARIAASAGVPAGTVKARLHRGRAALATALLAADDLTRAA